MPTLNATLEPEDTPIIGGAPIWDPLGLSSDTCYSVGCGYTGWIKSTFDQASVRGQQLGRHGL